MGEIIEKVLKEVDTVTGIKCDYCGESRKLSIVEELYNKYPNYIEYSLPSGGWGESTEYYKEYFCSQECMLKIMKRACFGGIINFKDL